MIECTAGGAKLQPRGPSFTPLELSPRIRPKSSVFVKAVARELLHLRSAETPDGTPAVPYIVFLVRPDGIAPYYLARTCLEPLGIAFGYELVEQKLAINIPDFDDLTTWDGTIPLEVPIEPAPAPGSSSRRMARVDQAGDPQKTPPAGSGSGDQGSMIGSLDGAGRGNRLGGDGGFSAASPQPEDFVWPGRARQAGRDGQRLPGAPGENERGSQLAAGDAAAPAGDRTAGGNSSDGGGPTGALRAMAGRELAKADASGSGGTPGSMEKGGAAASNDPGNGSGQIPITARGGRDSGESPGGAAASISPGGANAEDVGTGAARARASLTNRSRRAAAQLARSPSRQALRAAETGPAQERVPLRVMARRVARPVMTAYSRCRTLSPPAIKRGGRHPWGSRGSCRAGPLAVAPAQAYKHPHSAWVRRSKGPRLPARAMARPRDQVERFPLQAGPCPPARMTSP